MDNISKEYVKNCTIINQKDVPKHNQRSMVWEYFGYLHVKNNTNDVTKVINADKVYCKICLEKLKKENENAPLDCSLIKCYNKTVSTGNLKKHLQDMHNIENKKDDPATGNKRLSDFFSFQQKKRSCNDLTVPNKWKLTRDIVLWLCKDLLPFSTIEKIGFQDLFMKLHVLNSSEDLPSRYTLSRTALDDVYNSMLQHVIDLISNGPKFATLTCDIWTDNFRRRSYITFTYHHITDDFKLEYFTLSTKIFAGRHTGIAIKNEIAEVKDNFKLNDKDLTFVTDRGSNMILALKLENTEHHYCLGHGLHNLIVVDGLNENWEVDKFIKKVKKIVRTLRYRSPDLEKESDHIQQKISQDIDNLYDFMENELDAEELDDDYDIEDNIPLSTMQNLNNMNMVNAQSFYKRRAGYTTLKTSSSTRWHSTLMMLESLGTQRKAVNILLTKVDKNDLKLTHDDATLLFDLINFLKQFRTAVEVISAEKSTTLNYVVLIRSEIKSILEKEDTSQNLLISAMKQTMLRNFDHRFPLNDLIILGSMLDPRFQNLMIIEEYLKENNLTKTEFLIKNIKKYVLVSSTDANEVLHTNLEESQETYIEQLRKKHCAGNQNKFNSAVEAECLMYLGKINYITPDQGFAILQYWKDEEQKMPNLSKLAKKVLCVPATSTPSERVFSIAGLIVTAKRSSLSPINVNKIIFIHDNYNVCKEKLNIDV